MSSFLRIEISNHTGLVVQTKIDSKIEMGRQQRSEPAIYQIIPGVNQETDRLPISPLSENSRSPKILYHRTDKRRFFFGSKT